MPSVIIMNIVFYMRDRSKGRASREAARGATNARQSSNAKYNAGKLSQWLLFKTWLLITTTKNLVKRKNGFEFPLQTSEQKQNNTKKTFASHREVCIVKGNDNKAPTTLITFVLISG